jgi:hypothetical protein
MKDSAAPTPAPSVRTVRASFARIGQLGQQALEADTIDELRAIWELLCQAVAEHPLRMEPVADFGVFQRQIEAQRGFRASNKGRPRWEYHGDDGSLVTGQTARRKFDAHLARPHVRTDPRARGAGRPAVRGASRRASAKSGDSGDDGESSEPPSAGRTCECGCGQDVSHRAAQALYLNDRHAAADRQRRKRERDLLTGVPGLARTCQCKPMRNPLEPGVCHQCGHARGRLTADWVHDPGPSSRQLVIRDLSRRKWKTGDRRRHKVEHRNVEPRREVVA